MSGNSAVRVVLTERDLRLLGELTSCRVVDRDQAMKLVGFPSVNRINDRLLRLVGAGVLKRFFFGTAAGGTRGLYSLSKRGAAMVGYSGPLIQRPSDALLVADQFIHHQLAVNSVFLQAKVGNLPENAKLIRWTSFAKPISSNIALRPDGYFEFSTPQGVQACFCEVDLGTESGSVWNRKIELYLELALSGAFSDLFKQTRFRVLVVVNSERRMKSIRASVLKHTNKIFRFSTLDDINAKGLWSAIWLKVEGDQRYSLL